MFRVIVLVNSLLVFTTMPVIGEVTSPATTHAKASEIIKNRLTMEFLMLLNKFPTPKSLETTDDAPNTTATPSTVVNPSTAMNLSTAVTSSTAVTPSTEKMVEFSIPITLTTIPNVTSFSDRTHENLTCIASGANLPKIKPYDLSWYEQADGGKNQLIMSIHNGISLSMHRNMTRKYRGSTVYCVLIFNRLTQKHYAQLRGHYISIQTPAKTKKSYTAVISSAVTVACLLVMLVIAGLLYRKKRRNDPPTLSRELSVSSAVEAAYYSPIQTVPLYEAKAMAAANQKAKKGFPKAPPPLPARTHHSRRIDDENEYVYAYA